MSGNEGPYNARFKLGEDQWKEHCSATVSQIQIIGSKLKEQVRLELPTENGTIPAVYTLWEVHNGESDLVFVGNKIVEFVRCLQTQNTVPCKGQIKAQITKNLTPEQAMIRENLLNN